MSELEDAIEKQEEEYLDEVAAYVMNSFERARRHRDSIGMTEAIIDCLRRFRGKYSDSELAKFSGIEVYRGLTGMLVRSAYNWLKDAYFNAQDRPWTLEPTPMPELPERIRIQLEEAIEQQLQSAILTNSIDISLESQKRKLIEEFRNTASAMAYDFAKERTEAMTKLIEDQLIEADWRDIFSEFLLNLCIYPLAILKGPVVRKKKLPVWSNNKYTFKEESQYYFDNVNPLNFYPSPDSTNCQDGEFIIEVMPMTRARLVEAKSLKNFDGDAINVVIEGATRTYNRQARLAVDDNEMTELDGVGRTTDKTDGYMFDVYAYNGRISGDKILEFFEIDSGDIEDAFENFEEIDTDWGMIDPYEDYEVEAWVCDGVTIMLRENASKPIPYRPYYATSCYNIPNSIYGECIPMVIADLQDEINVAARARVYNMGMSSGPIVEADVSRMHDNDVPEQITPWIVYPIQSNGIQGNNNSPALRFNFVPDVSPSLTANMQEAWDKAHQIAGIPPYMYGDNRGSPQTLGAFSLQYANATKGIKTIISNVDQNVIEDAITQMYSYNMYYNEDEGIKADAKINVRGSAGLIAQEQRQARPLELLNALGPILAQMQPDTALALANETLAESGYDPAKLGASSGSRLEREAANRQIGVGQPQVDGRSGSVEQQIAAMSGPTPVPLNN